MATGKAADSKREEFRRYLERTGVMDALTKALVLLYEEQDKPDDALGYIKGQLGGGSGDDKNTKLEQENADLRAQLAHLMGGDAKPPGEGEAPAEPVPEEGHPAEHPA